MIGSCLFSGAAFADDTQQSEPLSSKQIISKNPDNLPSASAMFGPPGDGGGGGFGFGGGNSDTYVPPKTYTYNYAEINNVQMDVPTLTTALMGDSIDPASGGLKFTHNDVSLPGNFGLSVSASRTLSDPDNWFQETLEFGNWSLNLPHVRSSYIANYGTNNHNMINGAPYWTTNNACSGALNDNPDYWGNIDGNFYTIEKKDYWNGDFIHIPDKGTTQIIYESGLNKGTKNFWKINCVNNGGVDSFEVTTDDGAKYLFSELKTIASLKRVYMSVPSTSQCTNCRVPPIEWEDSLGGGVTRKDNARMQKWNAFMMITKVTDRHGNTVDYTYNNYGIIERIESSDGRVITFSGTTRINSMTVNGRTWQYQYSSNNPNEVTRLTKVILPDTKEWEFEYPTAFYNFWNKTTIGNHTQINPAYPTTCFGANGGNYINITHPAGAKGEFTLKERCMGQAEIPKIETFNPYGQGALFQGYEIPIFSQLWAVSNKKLILEDGTSYEWQYAYSENQGFFFGDTVNSSHSALIAFGINNPPAIPNISTPTKYINATYVINPDDSINVSYFNREYGEGNGNLLYSGVFDDNNVIKQKVKYTYESGAIQGATKNWTAAYYNVNNQRHPYLINLNTAPYTTQYRFRTSFGDDRNQLPKITETIVYGDTGGISTYTNTNHNYNQYEAATYISQSSDTASRHIVLGYDSDVSRWILNQPTTTRVGTSYSNAVAGTPMSQKTYYSKTHGLYPFMPYQEKWFGQTRKTYQAYHTVAGKKGQLHTIELNASLATSSQNRQVKFIDYKRGKPIHVQTNNRYGSGFMSMFAEVDNNGWTTKTTDFNDTDTHYGYWPMGEIKYVDYTNDPNQVWRDKWFSWSSNANGPVRTIQNCVLNGARTACSNSSTLTITEEYDSFYRTQRTATTGSGSTRYQLFDYDSNNQQTFVSHVSANANETKGTTHFYDTLNRMTKRQTTGMGEVNTKYLSGNRIQVIDALSNSTSTTFRAFNSPAFNQPTLIVSPENVTTSMVYDVYGNVTDITQSGLGDVGQAISVTEKRKYDSNNNLCMTVRPDVGATATKFNLMGELEWTAQGVSGVNASSPSCLSAKPTTIAVDFEQDNTGQLWKVFYPDSAPDITRTLDGNGNLLTMIAGSVSQTYTYNNQNLLLSETLSIPGRSTAISFDYEYTDLKYRSAITYPDNEKVSFYPNAFGQPTKVSRSSYHYANNVQYHPSGSVSSFAYGNGILHNTSIDANTTLPNIVKDMNGSSRVLYLDYAFDNNANVKSIIDGQNNAYSITSMTYDGLDRLTATSGNSGIGNTSLQYDSIGNITYFSSKNRTLDYTYNYSTNRLSSVSSTGSAAKSYSNFVHDEKGNITNNSHIAMSYNLANQMTSADGNSYLYDGFNRRVKTNSNEFSAYSQDGQLLYRQDGADHIQYMYLGSRLVANKKNTTVSLVHTDLLGSAVAETSPSKTLIDARQYYKAFGDTVGTTKDDVGYTGHKFDANIGLSYMQARYYDPVIGRFYSNDPVGRWVILMACRAFKGSTDMRM